MLQGKHSAILLTFIKLPFVIKITVLSIFEWRLYTGLTVHIVINPYHARYLYTGLDKQNFQRKNVNIFLPISFNICFGCSKGPSH